jgi:hypothetical protein
LKAKELGAGQQLFLIEIVPIIGLVTTIERGIWQRVEGFSKEKAVRSIRPASASFRQLTPFLEIA